MRFEDILQDVRYGVRVLMKNPGFAIAGVLTLALGIGANAAIFSLVYGVLLRPLPYESGGRLVVLHQEARHANQPDVPFSVKEILDYRNQSHTLDAVVEHHTMNFLLLGKDWAERVNTAVVSANFFDVLGVKPILGRTFVAADDVLGSNAVLILSYDYWRNRHSADPNIVGKVFQMNNRPHTVIGVLPPIPQYPVENDVYMPTSQCPFRSSARAIENRRARLMTAFGRLKPGVRLQQAQADLSTVASQMESANPEFYPKAYGYGLSVAPLQEDLTRRARTTFLVLLGAAGFVLLIACANVANLLLARLLKLERELAIRSALGAGRARLVRQLLTESVLMSLAGGLLGLAIAPATLALLVKFAARFTTRAAEVRIDLPVLLFTLGISLATGLIFGFAPAITTSANPASHRVTTSRAGRQLRNLLVVAQVAVSFVLLIGAGLMMRSFIKLQQVAPGFNPDRLLTMRLSPNFTRYRQPQQIINLVDSIMRNVRGVTGVQGAALATNFPFNRGGLATGPGSVDFEIEGRPVSSGTVSPQVDPTIVSTGYFETIGQPIVSGRSFTDHDDQNAPPVAVINQTMARHFWPNENPIGKNISFDKGQHWVRIEGIVADAKEYGLDRPVRAEVYRPIFQNNVGIGGNLVVRTAGDAAVMTAAVRAALHNTDPQLAVDRIATMDVLRAESVEAPRVTTILLGLFAGLALIISASGIAAVMALSVTQRRSELGIRMALGATRESILTMVVRQGVVMAAAGAAVGVAGAIVVTRLLSTLLFATSPTDSATFAGVTAVFLLVAGVASFVPAREVTAIDPVIALRSE